MIWKNCVNEDIPVKKYHKKIKHVKVGENDVHSIN